MNYYYLSFTSVDKLQLNILGKYRLSIGLFIWLIVLTKNINLFHTFKSTINTKNHTNPRVDMREAFLPSLIPKDNVYQSIKAYLVTLSA